MTVMVKMNLWVFTNETVINNGGSKFTMDNLQVEDRNNAEAIFVFCYIYRDEIFPIFGGFPIFKVKFDILVNHANPVSIFL